jgi:hypothetical protein
MKFRIFYRSRRRTEDNEFYLVVSLLVCTCFKESFHNVDLSMQTRLEESCAVVLHVQKTE